MRRVALTPFAAADAVLRDLAANAQAVLDDALVGVYIEGSFALGAGDEHSDIDFFVVLRASLNPWQEARIRQFHDELPTRQLNWAQHVEGSYLPLADLQDLTTVGGDWLFVYHGHREMTWDPHGNDMVHRWVLHEHGIAVTGPPAREISPVVPGDALRAEASRLRPLERDGLLGWLDLSVAWCQRYVVIDYCRVLYTLANGTVASKHAALEWAADTLDPHWRPLLLEVRDDRVRGFDRTDPPRPGAVEASLAFASYAEAWRP